jgi:hypothetical protein
LVDGRPAKFGVHRFRCARCGRSVSFLPDFCVPYKHFCTDVIGAVLRACLVLSMSVRAVVADPVHNAACFSRDCAGDWIRQFASNCHNLRHFGLPRLGVAAVPAADTPGLLLVHFLSFGAAHSPDARPGLRAVQCGLSGSFPPFGLFRAQLLPGCVT